MRDAGKSFQQVADVLNARGIRTKSGGVLDRVRVFRIMKVAA